jgi:hypothetical protein
MHCAAACSWDTRVGLYPPCAWVLLLPDRLGIVAVGWADEHAEMPRAAAVRINARFMTTPSETFCLVRGAAARSGVRGGG